MKDVTLCRIFRENNLRELPGNAEDKTLHENLDKERKKYEICQ